MFQLRFNQYKPFHTCTVSPTLSTLNPELLYVNANVRISPSGVNLEFTQSLPSQAPGVKSGESERWRIHNERVGVLLLCLRRFHRIVAASYFSHLAFICQVDLAQQVEWVDPNRKVASSIPPS